ncbi:ATP-binding protein [Roseateles oligotrophus]|uniref:histidine kinase n=1 Tax=Roseateles oligotrophus TaxID=1769250 RepID=A0ABT2YM55_9BURK|nr:ATP-binding protein [Roseateles oligotrophus]MCV2371147.1 PAS domain S-box protein [Roseateles oligotrophus]
MIGANILDRLARRRRAGQVLSIFVLLTSVGIVGQTWWAIRQDRQLTIDAERQSGLMIARLLEEHASQHLTVASAKLEAIATFVSLASLTDSEIDSSVQNIIDEQLKISRGANALQFVNLHGKRWTSMMDFPPWAYALEERSYIPLLLEHPENHGLIFGRPLKRFIDGELILPLARNLFDRSGRHIGLISTEINVDYFGGFYASVAKNNQAMVQLIADSGFVVVRSPADPRSAQLDLASNPTLKALLAGPIEGSVEDAGLLVDERRRLLSYRKIRGFPLMIGFGRDFDSVLANWKARAWDQALFSGVFIAFNLLLSYYLLLHMRRVQASEGLLRESESKFVDLFQRSPVPLALILIDGHEVVEANDALLTQFAYTRTEYTGKSPLDAAHWQSAQCRQDFLGLLDRQLGADGFEAQMLRQDGSLFTCLLAMRTIDSGGRRVGIVSVIDISRQRQVEQEIRELNAELEQRVSQRTLHLEQALATVKNMQGELVRSEKMAALGSLVAGIAHELNTPIGNGLTMASTIEAHSHDLLGEFESERPRRSRITPLLESIQQGADILVRSLERAAALISSFKHVAVDQSSDQRRDFDLKATIEELVLMLASMYRGLHRVELDLSTGVQMNSYPGALTQALTNFISNSVAHAFPEGKGGVMRISSRLMAEGQVEIVFSDDGCGIAAADLEHVFEPFFTTKLGQGGSGLGMSIVYNLVTGVLGGSISLSSSVGSGTRLHLVLPLKAPTLSGPSD